MENWPSKKKIAVIAALFAVYFPVALYFKSTYIPQPAPPKDRIWLTGPFLPFTPGGNAYLAWLPKFEELADTPDTAERSPIVLYENDRILGPAHSRHQEIADLGGGRYSHWTGMGIVFSTTDNSDPNKNWKLYWVRRSDQQSTGVSK